MKSNEYAKKIQSDSSDYVERAQLVWSQPSSSPVMLANLVGRANTINSLRVDSDMVDLANLEPFRFDVTLLPMDAGAQTDWQQDIVIMLANTEASVTHRNSEKEKVSPISLEPIFSRCDVQSKELSSFLTSTPLAATLLIEFLDKVDEVFTRDETSRYRLTWESSEQEIYVEIMGTGDADADVDRLWSIDYQPPTVSPWSIVPLLRYDEGRNV